MLSNFDWSIVFPSVIVLDLKYWIIKFLIVAFIKIRKEKEKEKMFIQIKNIWYYYVYIHKLKLSINYSD